MITPSRRASSRSSISSGIALRDDANSGSDKIVTAVRVRPMSDSELLNHCKVVMIPDNGEPGMCIIDPVYFGTDKKESDRKAYERHFQYDHLFWSANKSDNGVEVVTQEQVFNACAKPLVGHCITGFNCAIFAYGQTGSGKTHTMMGYDSHSEGAGVIPRLVRALLEQVNELRQQNEMNGYDSKIDVSYYEIYNEKVHDLLSNSTEVGCRVREHPDLGAYVEDLTRIEINNYKDVDVVLQRGHKHRAVASTLLNSTSSRSHAVFNVYLAQTLSSTSEGHSGGSVASDDSSVSSRQARISKNSSSAAIQRQSKVCLVDLAGSERASATGVSGERLTEANSINKSLSALGDVIQALSSKSNKSLHVPYRNSVLTWLLKDSIGGNSKSVMLATVSPTDAAYFESMSTLRYVERAKLISNHAVVNETTSDANLISQLQKQVQALQKQLSDVQTSGIKRHGSSNSLKNEGADDMQHMMALLNQKQQVCMVKCILYMESFRVKTV